MTIKGTSEKAGLKQKLTKKKNQPEQKCAIIFFCFCRKKNNLKHI